jgi:hypothetical protein
MRARCAVLLLASLLAACGGASGIPPGSDGGPDDGLIPDGAPAAFDGGDAIDGGATPDGGTTRDGGVADGGAAPDGGPDGGAMDGGPSGCPLPARDGGPTNPGWIGGPCARDGDCAYDGGVCLRETEGFPGGLCSMRCSGLCPDRFGPDDMVTFCVAGSGRLAGGGMCVSRCDFQREPLGCRTGYHCLPEARFNDALTLRTACTVGSVACYEAASEHCIDYRAAPNPLDRPADCPQELCDVRDAMYVKSPIRGLTHRNGSGNVADLFMSCPLSLALHRMNGILAEMDVVEVTHYGTYSCRQIAGSNCVLSQHGLGLAIDLASFKLRNGTVVSILNDWEPAQSIPIETRRDNPCRFDYTPTTEKGRWLYDLVHRMCDARVWSIILTPNYNTAHDNHLHVDLTAGYSRTFLGAPATWTVLAPNPGGE